MVGHEGLDFALVQRLLVLCHEDDILQPRGFLAVFPLE